MRSHLKSIAVSLAWITIFYNCAPAYQGSYTLQQAMAFQRPVRLTTHQGQSLHYMEIDTLNREFIGVKTVGNGTQNDVIIPGDIQKIEMKRSREAERREGLLIVGILGGIVLAIVLISSGLNNANFLSGN